MKASNCSLLSKTLALLKKHPNIASLARELNIPANWFYELLRGDYKDPSVNRIQAVFEHITGRKLNVK